MDFLKRLLTHETGLAIWAVSFLLGIYCTHLIWKGLTFTAQSKLHLFVRMGIGAASVIGGWVTLGFTIVVFMRDYPGLSELLRQIAEAVWVPAVFLKVASRSHRYLAFIPVGLYAAFEIGYAGFAFRRAGFSTYDVVSSLACAAVSILSAWGISQLLKSDEVAGQKLHALNQELNKL